MALGHNGRVSEPNWQRDQAVDYRLGGAVGRRAHRTGRWFDPVTWALVFATINWLVLMVRQVPCRPTEDGFPSPFMRLCYSDIPTLYLGRGISTGAGFYTEVPLEYPVLIGYLMSAARGLTRAFGEVSPEASFEAQVAASQVFFQVNAVLLFCFFAATVVIHLRMGRRSAESAFGGPVRQWDALLIAASPVVLANGLINWDMLPVMLTSLGLLVWSRRQPLIAGGVFGLAIAAKFYPVLVLIAITLACLRAGRLRAIGQLWAGAVVAWLVVNLPIMMAAWDGWSAFWTMNADRGADLGSIWYVFHLIGLDVPALSAVAFLCMAAGGLGIAWLVLLAPRRPRIGQIALLLMVTFLIFNKVYSPQYALWLLPLVVLARPKLPDVAVWTLGEVFYFVAIWGFLDGLLGPDSKSKWIYWFAVIVRISLQLWFSLRVIDDIMRPWEDPIRLPLVDDPLGGVLDHTADPAWLIAAQDWARRPRLRTPARRALEPEQ
jgi:hypothetical protein